MTTNTLRFIYDREVVGKTGTIKIYDASNNLLKTINSDDPYVNYNYTQDNRTKVEADISELGITWTKNTSYTITVDAGFVEEVGNNRSLSPAQNINYTTPNEPFVESTVPANNSTNILSFTIQLIFDEDVQPNTGNFYVYESNTLVATISVNDARITYNEKTVLIDLDGLIGLGKTYHIRGDLNAVKNGFNFLFLGINNDTVLKFTISDVTHNLTLSNPNPSVRFFGSSVDVSNNYIAVASSRDTSQSLSNGQIHVFDISGNFLRTITDPGPTTSLGRSQWPYGLTITDQYLAFGSDQADPSTAPFINIHIYNISNGSLIRTITLPSPQSSGTTIYYSGRSIAIDGDRIAIGELRANNPNDADIVYVYNITTGALLRTITRTTSIVDDGLGPISIGLSGDNLIFEPGIQDATGPQLQSFIYSVNTGNLIRTITMTAPETISNVAIDSTYYIIKTNQNIRIYSVANGNLLFTIPDSYFLPAGAELNISGKYLMSGSKLIDISKGNVLKDLTGTIDGVSITNTNCRTSIAGNKIVVGVTSAEKTLLLTSPLP